MDLKSVFRKLSGSDTRAIRIPVKPGDKKERYVALALQSSFQFLDILSLRLAETDAYRLFDAQYGIVAGRVIGNEGVGIPNAKIAIFIPRDPTQVSDEPTKQELAAQLVDSLYSYERLSDEDGDGRRYNILPAASRNRGFNGFPENTLGIGATPKVPVGSFAEKEDVLTNASLLSVYEKYYKYTTVTNDSGDYLLFGVPVGSYTVHMDCDLTDIGRWSMSPLLMTKTLGYPKELFDEDGTKVLASSDLDSLPHVQSQNITVQVKPLWSQNEEKQDIIGVTRQDFKISAHLKPFFTVFGSNFTMSKSKWWGDRVIFRIHWGWKNMCFGFGPDLGTFGTLCKGFRLRFKLGFRFGIDLKLFSIGNPAHRGLTIEFNPTLDVQIANVMPFVAFEVSDNYCRLSGGKYDSGALDIINHGNTCQCSIQDALKEIPNDGISDGLMLSSHRVEPLNIKLFNLDKNGISDADALTLRSQIDTFVSTKITPTPVVQTQAQIANNGVKTLIPYNTDLLNKLDTSDDIKLMLESEYVKLVEPGQFILQVPTNRRLMITSEDGTLIDSPDPNKGVYTEFRGYMYVNSDSEIDNPPTTARTGRIALKIPQKFDYSFNPKIWMLDHGLFQAGELYSVAQKYPTAHTEFSSATEEENDLDGPSNGVVGWDNQTGLLMDVDYGSKGTRAAGMAPMAITPNHVTFVGDEFDYTPPNVSGDATANAAEGTMYDASASETSGYEGDTAEYSGSPLSTSFQNMGFKIDIMPMRDINQDYKDGIVAALEEGAGPSFQSCANRAGKDYIVNGNPAFGRRYTVNGEGNLIRIEYQGSPSAAATTKFTFECYFTDLTPTQYYQVDNNVKFIAYDMWLTQPYHENVTNIYYYLWKGDIHADVLAQLGGKRSTTINWRVFNDANKNEYGVTGSMPLINLP